MAFADLLSFLGELVLDLGTVLSWPRGSPDSGSVRRKLPFGPVLSEKRYLGDPTRVVRTLFFADGRRRRETSFENGHKHGHETAWYRSGRKRWVGEWRAGRQTGEWFYFRRDGKLDGQRTGMYENGLRYAAMKGFNDWNA